MVLRYIFAVVFLLLLSHCSSVPGKSKSSNDQAVVTSRPQLDAQQLINQASSQSSPEAERSLLRAVAILQQQQQWQAARQVLEQIFQNYLTQELWQDYQIALFKDAIAQQQGDQALALLQQIDNQHPLHQAWYAEALALTGRIFDATIIRMQLSADGNGDYDEDIWQVLQNLSPGQLKFALQRFEQPAVKGWLELMQLFNQQHTDIHRQNIALNGWRIRWPNHPANLQLPNAVNAVKQSSINSPKTVALLLPLTGTGAVSGQAIRDGFSAALLNAASNQNPVPLLRYYDTNSADINQLYQQAIGNGAELVVGPLRKSILQQLTQQSLLSVPTLALNRIETLTPISNLVQFALALEDEVTQMTELALKQGWKNALVLYPNDTLGLRAKTTFSQQWLDKGGTIVAEQALGDAKSYSKMIMDVLQINRSKQRAKDLETLLRTDLAFEPRRRQDIDFIFLYANSQQAQAIKPFLKYHYAGDLPVYATSRIYSGALSKGNNDLNGIWFCDIPWQFDHDPLLKSNITHAWPEAHGNLGRLYALGVDAYRLHSRLLQWQDNPQLNIYGATGVLSLNALGQIQRRTSYATIHNGKAQALPEVIDDTPLLSSRHAKP